MGLLWVCFLKASHLFSIWMLVIPGKDNNRDYSVAKVKKKTQERPGKKILFHPSQAGRKLIKAAIWKKEPIKALELWHSFLHGAAAEHQHMLTCYMEQPRPVLSSAVLGKQHGGLRRAGAPSHRGHADVLVQCVSGKRAQDHWTYPMKDPRRCYKPLSSCE